MMLPINKKLRLENHNFLGEKLTPHEQPSSALGLAWTSKEDLIISDL